MSNLLIRLLLLGSMLGVCACGASGGDHAEQPGFFFGSTTARVAANGLQFAEAGVVLGDIDGQVAKIRMVHFALDEQSGDIALITSDADIDFTDSNRIRIMQNGRVVVDSDDPDRSVFVAPGAFSGLVFAGNNDAILSDPNLSDRTLGFAVFGFETSPDVIAQTMGQAMYHARLTSLGAFVDGDGDVVAANAAGSGDLFLAADFDTNTIAGGVTLVLGTVDNGDIIVQDDALEIDLELNPTDISGNGFAGSLIVHDCSVDSCSSQSKIGGVFYGPDPIAVAGIAGIDVTLTDGAETGRYIGAGAFTSDFND